MFGEVIQWGQLGPGGFPAASLQGLGWGMQAGWEDSDPPSLDTGVTFSHPLDNMAPQPARSLPPFSCFLRGAALGLVAVTLGYWVARRT